MVCAQMTEDFLAYTRAQGNDLSTPAPMYGFPGLKSGDRWCLCAARWAEAERAGVAPLVERLLHLWKPLDASVAVVKRIRNKE